MAKIPDNDTAVTRPSKGFFVNMLTRDISINDAILDLIDNSLDGVRRLNSKLSKHYVKIEISKNKFKMSDNCGGIPLDVAKQSAFAFGRPDGVGLTDSGTVGVYGIGMKRSILKLGRTAVVESRSFKTKKLKKKHDFSVAITQDWLKNPDWIPLDISEIPQDGERGTTIEVTNLNNTPAEILSTRSAIKELREIIEKRFALILDQGFRIFLKGPGYSEKESEIKSYGQFFELLEKRGKQEIAPFIVTGSAEDVEFEIYVGFIGNPARSQDDSEADVKADKVRSGWTVACNDRIILWRDRSILTSWGANSVGSYHSQYNSIAGLVLLYGKANDLPWTTTKAGIDLSNQLYQKVLKVMAAATKELTSFTNKVKKDRDGYSEIIEKAVAVGLTDLRKKSKKLTEDKENKSSFSELPNSFVQIISTPHLDVKKKDSGIRISYKVPKEDFRIVSDYLELKTASVVGRETFDLVLEEALEDE